MTTALRDQLLGALDTISEVLAGAADDAERERTLPEAAWRALHEHGLFRIKAPAELGGVEADPVTQLLVYEKAAYIDSSAGWAVMVGSGTLGAVASQLPEEGLKEFMTAGRLPRLAGSFIPARSTALKVDGGYRVTGRWPFASGSRHAEWLFANAVVEGGEPGETRAFVLPAASATLLDTWHVSGLKGTGSSDFEIDDLFVPDRLSFAPTGVRVRGGAPFRLGVFGFVANEHAGVALGIARRALDEIADVAKRKSRGLGAAQGVAARPVFQHDYGRLDLAVRAAKTLMIDLYDAVWPAVVDGAVVDDAWGAQIQAAAVYATEISLEACRAAFKYAGGHALYTGNILDRCLRDVQAAAQHVFVADSAYEAYGQTLLA